MKRIVAALFSVLLLGAHAPTHCASALSRFYGEDAYTIDGRNVMTVVYDGTQSLRVSRVGADLRFENVIEYTKTLGSRVRRKTARVVRILTPDLREIRTSLNQDEDSLSLLDQPFAARIDGKTLAALAGLTQSIPFTASSPLGGAPLHGSLRAVGSPATVPAGGVRVAFTASGPMRGPLPELPTASIDGKISLVGTAEYDAAGALVRLRSRLRITGLLAASGQSGPIEILFVRRFAPDCAPTAAPAASPVPTPSP